MCVYALQEQGHKFKKKHFFIFQKESMNIMEKNQTVGLNIQTIEIQKYIFLGNINYIQNIKIYILVWAPIGIAQFLIFY